MLEGIYHVTFSSSTNSLGEGIAVFKGDSVNGGDRGYLYTGTTYTAADNQFKSALRITQWNPAVSSVFGAVKEFVLELAGSSAGDKSFLAQGHVAGQPHAKITIRGRFLSPAA
jgi:hypothetical protein